MRVLYFSRAYTTHDRRFLQGVAGEVGPVYYLQLEDDGVSYENRPLPQGVVGVKWAGGGQRYSTPDKLMRLLPDLDSTIQAIRPDIIHAGPVLSCAFLVALLGLRPLLTVSWGSDILVDAELTEWNKWAASFTLDRSDLFLCDCLPVKEKAQSMAHLQDSRVVKFPWGIELNRYVRNETRRRSGREDLRWTDCCVVVSTRTWDEGYSIDLVVDVFARAYRSNPTLRLLLLGNGPAEPEIRRQIERHGLDQVVYCPGRVAEDEMADMLLLADIYLCCAPSDGTSVSLLEAMAMQLPVLVADNPGNRQWVTDGTNGRLVRVGDAHEFSVALLQTAADLEARIRMGNAGRRIVEERADWDKNVGLLLDAYRNLEKLAQRWQTDAR